MHNFSGRVEVFYFIVRRILLGAGGYLVYIPYFLVYDICLMCIYLYVPTCAGKLCCDTFPRVILRVVTPTLYCLCMGTPLRLRTVKAKSIGGSEYYGFKDCVQALPLEKPLQTLAEMLSNEKIFFG